MCFIDLEVSQKQTNDRRQNKASPHEGLCVFSLTGSIGKVESKRPSYEKLYFIFDS